MKNKIWIWNFIIFNLNLKELIKLLKDLWKVIKI